MDFDANTIATWAGVLLGLPSFLALFFSGKWVEGSLVFVLVIFMVIMRWFWALPEFTVLVLEKELTIKDRDARTATLVRRAEMRTNHKGIREWWCRNIASDGAVSNILIDGHPPD